MRLGSAAQAGRSTAAAGRLAFLAALLIITSCAAPQLPPADIVLISIDTLRRDHVSAYGYERPTTPEIDRIADQGALFQNAVSTSNWTLPSHMSLMTGLPPSLHRVEDDGARLAGEVMTLAQALRQSGYATGGVTSHVYLGKQFGFARGFDHYETWPDQRAEQVTDRAIGWLETLDSGPFFLFAHYFDPHTDYAPPEPFASRFGPADRRLGEIDSLKYHWDPANPLPPESIPQLLRLYDGEVAYTDHQVGRLLDWLRGRGQLDRTIVAIVSDHGEDFGDHGTFGHGMHLHGEVTRIPFVLRYPPGVEAGPRGELVTLSDVPFTLLRLAGATVPEQFQLRGVDLSRPAAAGSDRSVVLESTRWGPKRFAVRSSTHVLESAGSFSPIIVDDANGDSGLVKFGPIAVEPGLYDLVSDPQEVENLIDRVPLPATAGMLEEALSSFIAADLRAARLTCTGNGAPQDYRVELRTDGEFADEPFCLDAAARFGLRGMESTFAPRSLSSIELEVTLRSSEPVTLFLSLDAKSRELFIDMRGEGEAAHEGAVEFPAAGESVVVHLSGDAAPRCVLDVTDPSLSVSGEASELSEDDLEQLRALGYVG